MGLLVVVLTVLTVGIVLFVRTNLEGAGGATRMQLRQLVDTGAKARAKVLRLDPTGQVVNNITLQCLVQFQMQPLDGSPPFSVHKTMMVSRMALPRAGDVWPAWYDRSDRSVFTVGMPDGSSVEQIPVYREFGIKHPLDNAATA